MGVHVAYGVRVGRVITPVKRIYRQGKARMEKVLFNGEKEPEFVPAAALEWLDW